MKNRFNFEPRLGWLVDLAFTFLVFCGITQSAFGSPIPVTTIEDFVGVADINVIGQMPYYMSVLALLLVPIVVQGIKRIKDLPTWVLWALPSVLSLGTACITAIAQGFLPWTNEGLNIVLAIMLGGVGGQSIYVANEQRVKAVKRGTINSPNR